MTKKLALVISAFIVFTLLTWGFDVEGGRYLQQIALVFAGFVFGNLLTSIALESNDEN
jgi:hypothetical protein